MHNSIGKIALIEAAFHHEVLEVYILLLAPHAEEILIFTKPNVHSFLSSEALLPNCHFYLHHQSNKDFNHFLSDHNALLQGVKISIVITPQISLNEFVDARILSYPVAVLHNAFSSLFPLKHLYIFENLPSFPTNIVRLARSLLKLSEIKKRNAYRIYQKFFTTSQESLSFLKEYFPTIKNKLALAPIGYFHKLSLTSLQKGKVRIVIPGTVDGEVRDYDEVFKAFAMFNDLSQVELTLLGGLKNKKSATIVQKFESLVLTHRLTLHAFQKSIPTLEYNVKLFEADFLILPSRKIIRDGISYARVGQSGTSGTIADALLYAQPCLVPNHLIIPPILETISERYGDLLSLKISLQKWIDDRSFETLKKTRMNAEWEDFSLSNQGTNFAKEIIDFIQTKAN